MGTRGIVISGRIEVGWLLSNEADEVSLCEWAFKDEKKWEMGRRGYENGTGGQASAHRVARVGVILRCMPNLRVT
jgi:hypothetical protein